MSPEVEFSNSPTRRVDDSPTGRVGESANMTILAYSCGLQSSLYTKNHRFTFKALIFCIESLSIKKEQALKLAKILTQANLFL
jgi:hypothetical protein